MISGSRIRVLAATLALAMGNSYAHDEGEFHIVMEMLSSVEESHVEYTEIKSLAMLDSTIEQTGTLSYFAPATVMREMQEPISEVFKAEGNLLIVRRANTETVRPLDTEPFLRAFVESFRATLSGNARLLRDHYHIEFSGTAMKWSLLLNPKSKRLRRFIRSIKFEGQETLIGRIDITEANGDWSRMTLTPASAPKNAE